MKKHTLILCAAALALVPLEAAKKKPSKDPAHAEAWVANPKAFDGKKVTTYAYEAGDMGMVLSTASFAIVPLATCNAGGQPGDVIPVVVPTAKAQAFVKSLAPKSGKGGTFGSKRIYAPVTGTFTLLQGEPALVLDAVTDEVKKIKPSALLAKQHDPKQGQEEAPEKPAEPAPKPAPKVPAGKKPAR